MKEKMKCPKCKSNLIKNDGQGACLVAHQDNLEYTADGKLHDHATPCDYGGGIHYKCKNGHKVAIPTINTCWCGHVEKANDGGFHNEYERHPTATIPWQESADYWGRRLREEVRWDYIGTRNDGNIGGDFIQLDVKGNIAVDMYNYKGNLIPQVWEGAELISPKL